MHRCVVCDRTNNRSLQNLPGQYFAGPYFDDEQSDGEICQECLDAINDDLFDKETEDDDISFSL